VNDDLRSWTILGTISTAVIVVVIPLSLLRGGDSNDPSSGTAQKPRFVGRAICKPCHETEFAAWLGSDHDRAMAETTDETVLGDFSGIEFMSHGITSRFFKRDSRFMVTTEGPDGEMADFEVTHTFGVEPLQQYLIPFSGGRLQCLNIAWDSQRRRWFDLNPDQVIPSDDWLHWTRAAQTWNGMCAECHSTNLKKGFDARTRSYTTTWSEIDVSCEACHGPGSAHVEWAEIQPMARPEIDNVGLVVRTGNIQSTQLVDLCAPCHSRRSELGDYDHTQATLLDIQIPSLLEEGTYFADGQILQEDYVWGSFTQSKMYHNDVRCSDCHDSHSLKLKFEGNELCAQCHRADVYDTREHHFHKKVYEDKPSDGALCVKCHMPESTFMVIDWRADHSIRIPRPDLSVTLNTPNACSQKGCHNDKPLGWSVDAFTKWYGLAKKPHYGTTLAAGREGRPEALPQLVRMTGDDLYPAIVRATALSLLTSYPGPESRRAFAAALVDENPLVRYTAVNSVEAEGPESLVEVLIPLLFDPVRAIRLQTAVRLADTPDALFKPYQRKALDEALAGYEGAMKYSLDFSFAGHNLGNLAVRLGKDDEAEQHFREAIAIDDLFYPAKVNLAVLLNGKGRNEEAEALLREVIEAYPERHQVAYSLGLLLAEMGRYPEAEQWLARAATGMPNHPGAKRNLTEIRRYLESIGDSSEPAGP